MDQKNFSSTPIVNATSCIVMQYTVFEQSYDNIE